MGLGKITVENLPHIDEINTALCERSLHEYVKLAWNRAEPKPFTDGWHIQAICEHLEAVSKLQIRNLIICVPPRHTKSLTVSVMWPSWEWGPFDKPGTRWLCTSYAQSLSIRDSWRCRLVIQSPWYQQRWGHRFYLMGDQNEKKRYNTSQGGQRVSSSVEGMGTGEGGDRLVIDDPISLKDIHSQAARQNVIDWYKDVLPSRLNDPKTGCKVIIMQRCHELDLVGYIIGETEEDDWEKLILPAEYEKKFHCSTSIGFNDPRKKAGELLWPERFDQSEVNKLKVRLGSYNYSAQYQQRPAPSEGGIIKRHWFQYFKQRPQDLVDEMDIVYQSWDMAFKDLDESDFVCGGVWGIKGADRYRLDEIHARLSFTETKKAVKSLTSKWPQTKAVYVEDKANGTAILDDLKSSISGMIAFEPEGSKESRAYSVTPEIEAGNVYLPASATWLDEYLEELAQFNKGAHDDRVDETSQALLVAKKLIKRANRLASVVSVTKEAAYAKQQLQVRLERSKWKIGADE